MVTIRATWAVRPVRHTTSSPGVIPPPAHRPGDSRGSRGPAGSPIAPESGTAALPLDFNTVHHELGHNFYQLAYHQQPFLFKDSANDGFHEAIGDTIALSVTPEYLKQIGLIDKVPPASEDMGLLLQQALDKVAFLPFGLLIDQWRWKVFSGEIKPADYNKAWWDLRREVPGRRARRSRAARRTSIRARSTTCRRTCPYTRYFLARHPAVPVPPRALPGGRPQGAAAPLLDLRQQGGGRAAAARCWRWARAGRGPRRSRRSPARADGRHRDRRLLRAAEDVARRAEPWPPGRLVTVLISSSLPWRRPGAAPQGSWERRSPAAPCLPSPATPSR